MDRLVEMLSGELDGSIKERVGREIVSGGLWAEVIGLASHPDPRIVFRAAWALEWAYNDSPEGLLPYIDEFVEAFLASDNGSVHREYLKILCDIRRRRSTVFVDKERGWSSALVDKEYEQNQEHMHAWLAQIAEKAFDLLVAPDTKTAVKGWCIEILMGVAPHLDWVGEALEETLHWLMENNPSPGLANRCQKALRTIRRVLPRSK
jgi:hypothetical protein